MYGALAALQLYYSPPAGRIPKKPLNKILETTQCYALYIQWGDEVKECHVICKCLPMVNIPVYRVVTVWVTPVRTKSTGPK